MMYSCFFLLSSQKFAIICFLLYNCLTIDFGYFFMFFFWFYCFRSNIWFCLHEYGTLNFLTIAILINRLFPYPLPFYRSFSCWILICVHEFSVIQLTTWTHDLLFREKFWKSVRNHRKNENNNFYFIDLLVMVIMNLLELIVMKAKVVMVVLMVMVLLLVVIIVLIFQLVPATLIPPKLLSLCDITLRLLTFP